MRPERRLAGTDHEPEPHAVRRSGFCPLHVMTGARKSRGCGGIATIPKKTLSCSCRTPAMTQGPRALGFLRQRFGQCLGIEARHLVRSKTDGHAAVEKLVHGDRTASQGVAPT